MKRSNTISQSSSLQFLSSVLLLIATPLLSIATSQAATIQVTAQLSLPGCDLIEAIDSANTNSAVGGCAAGAAGQDIIVFSPNFSRYELSDSAFSDPVRGTSATPEITSEVKIIGSGDELMVIAIPPLTSVVRLFTVSFDGDLSLENLSLQGGSQQGGLVDGVLTGGAVRVAGKLTLDQVEIANNDSAFGGAIWVQGGEIIIRNSLFRSNHAARQGGAIGLSSNSRATIYDSTFSNNSAGDYGGGVSLASSPNSQLTFYNATLTENSAGISGGGISAFFAIPVIGETSNSLTIRNTIISGNTADTSNREVHIVNPFFSTTDIRNSVLGSSASTFGQASNSTDFLRNDNIVSTSNFNNTALRAILAPLSDNGGKTMTHALVANSPAIDKGLPSLLTGGPLIFFVEPGCRGETIGVSFTGEYRADQRNIDRPIGIECDIGAFEYEPPEEDCYVVKAQNNNVFMFCL